MFSAIIIFIVAFILSQTISKPIIAMSNVSNEMSKGNLSIRNDISSNDELALLASAFNELADVTEANSEIQANVTSISDIMLKQDSLFDFSNAILKHLIEVTHANMGTFYILNREKEAFEHYTSIGANKDLLNPFKVNNLEGEIGNVISSKTIQHITDLPDKTKFKINTTGGTITPKEIISIPIIVENEVVSVISLININKFREVCYEILKQSSININSIYTSLLAKDQAKLFADNLEETNKKLILQSEKLMSQAEELRVNQEELVESNAGLEAQANILQANEEELKAQQEELLQSNQELEEKRSMLELKNIMVNQKNDALKIAGEELEISSRYKSEFLANMSHELRTPLNSILLLSKLLSDNPDLNLTDEQIEFSNVIHDSGNGLLELINEILDLSKIEAGKMDLTLEKININDLCKGLKGVFNPLANDKKIKYEYSIDKKIDKFITTDRIRLEQILKNLLSNAIKFTQKGKVKLDIYTPDKNVIYKNLSLKEGEVIAYAISDTGIGIPEDKKAYIFEAFRQVDGSTQRQFGGTGLGLSISREIAGLLGGEIAIESKVGKGSTFILYLPVNTPNPSITGDEIVGKNEITLTKKDNDLPADDEHILQSTPKEIKDDRKNLKKDDKVILIVEDNTDFAKALIQISHNKNYKAVVSVSGKTALEYANKYNPIGILLDVQLPVISGWSVISELKKDIKTRAIPVYMISALDISRKKCLDFGAIDFIKKPINEKKVTAIFDKIQKIAFDYPKKILLVEDNKAHHLALKNYIGNSNKICISAYSAKEGLTLLKKENIDCVILDIGLPDESGFQLLEKIRKQKQFETLPIIVYTGMSLSLSEEQKIKKYARTIVVKTVDSYKRLMDEVILSLHLGESVVENSQENNRTLYVKVKALSEKKVLVVDDDVRNVFSLTKTLENQKMIVVSANNGNEAIQILEKNSDIDLVLMDMMMPEKDGYETMEEIRKLKQWKKIPIIAVTAKTMKGDRQKCIKFGASDYISKPVDIDQLISLLRIWLSTK
jgi:signal transduction histidine kinase/CheY-like chemotaxis protein/HAMP domain-containing protein